MYINTPHRYIGTAVLQLVEPPTPTGLQHLTAPRCSLAGDDYFLCAVMMTNLITPFLNPSRIHIYVQ